MNKAKMSVYLGGPIGLVSKDEAKSWRDVATEALSTDHFEVINPLNLSLETRADMDKTGVFTLEHATTIVEADLEAIDKCDALLVNASGAGWGTPMEVMYAHNNNIDVYAFGSPQPVPLWLMYHSFIIRNTLEEAMISLCASRDLTPIVETLCDVELPEDA